MGLKVVRSCSDYIVCISDDQINLSHLKIIKNASKYFFFDSKEKRTERATKDRKRDRERAPESYCGCLLLTEIHSTYRRVCYDLLFPHRLIYNPDSQYGGEQKPRQILKRLKACITC